MLDWWNNLDLTAQIFALIAIPSTLVLLFQTVLMLFGIGDGHGDADAGFDTDTDFDTEVPDGAHFDFHTDGHLEDGGGLHMFSIRGIFAMLCIGGWSGLVMYQAGWSMPLTICLALLFGVLTLLAMGYVMYGVSRLQSNGNVDPSKAIGKTGTVYLPIPPGSSGHGKVNLTLQEQYLELEAITAGKRRIATGELVRVVGLNETGLLVVEPLRRDGEEEP